MANEHIKNPEEDAASQPWWLHGEDLNSQWDFSANPQPGIAHSPQGKKLEAQPQLALPNFLFGAPDVSGDGWTLHTTSTVPTVSSCGLPGAQYGDWLGDTEYPDLNGLEGFHLTPNSDILTSNVSTSLDLGQLSEFGFNQGFLTQPMPYHGGASQSTLKPYNCTYPGCRSRGFNRKYELQRHAKKHSRQQLFPCPVAGCPYQDPANASYRRDKLQSHIKNCHPGFQPNNGSVPVVTTPAVVNNSVVAGTASMSSNVYPQGTSQL